MNKIALLLLLGDRGRYMAIVIGLTFASLIMTQQPGIYFGLMKRTQSYVEEIGMSDIWVMDPTVQYIEESKPLRDTELQRVRGIEGVEWAVPLYQGFLIALLPDGSRQALSLTGIDDATMIGGPRKLVEGNIQDLRKQDSIILDQVAAEERFAYKDKAGIKHPVKIGDVLEINDHRAVVVGISKMERTFTTIPIAFTTFSRAMSYAPQERRMLTYVLAKVKPGYDPAQVAARISKDLRLAAYTTEQFKQMNTDYWFDNTGLPVNFGLSVLLGFLVGATMAGQTFYNFVRENLKAFAVLKAMGVSNGRLVRMVIFQALVIGSTGYGIGIGLSSLFGYAFRDSAVAFLMSWKLLLFSASGIGIIMLATALFGIRSVIKLDPASVFRG